MSNSRMFRDSFAWLKAVPLLAVAGALAVIAIWALASAQSPDGRLREQLFDYFQRLAPADDDAGETFHVVLIDRESVNLMGPWPWPRTVLADLVEAAAAAGASGVILTEPADAPDPLSPETIGAFWLEGASDDALARELARLPSTDETLAAAFDDIAGGVGVSLTPPANPAADIAFQRAAINDAPWLSTDQDNARFLALPAARYLYSFNAALAAAAPPAIAALAPDADGDVRRLPLLWSLNGAPAASIALRAAQLSHDDTTVRIVIDQSAIQSQGRIVRRIGVGNADMPVAGNTAMRLYMPKRINAPTTSAAQLLGRNANSQLAGKVVLIGRDGEIGDLVQTARGALPAAAVHALAAAQIASGSAASRPGWAGYMEALAVMVLGAAAIMTAQRLQFWQAVGFAAAISAVLTIGAFIVFAGSKILLDPLAPSLALFVGALSVAGGRSIGGALRDDSVRGSFHDTLPEPIMKRLREGESGAILSGVQREITVLACELRIADEDLETMRGHPDDVTKIIAAASIDLRETIIDAGGAADQADGGRAFAYFNTPGDQADHIQAGCATALRLIESMDKINTDLESSSRTRGIQVHLAIGVATGQCFAGPMGHGRHNRYSAFGPAVDHAMFLRGLSAYYGPAMICDETVYKETHHQFAYLELDKITTRDTARPFSIYALIGNPFIKSSKGFRELDDAHRALLAAYRRGDFIEAREHLAKIKKTPGAKIALFDIYEERLNALARNGVPDDWDGVMSAKA